MNTAAPTQESQMNAATRNARVVYEWDVETVAAADTPELAKGDVIDHYHCATYAEALTTAARTPEVGTLHEIVLVRDDDDGRAWAYVIDGALPERFEDASGSEVQKVPARFRAACLSRPAEAA